MTDAVDAQTQTQVDDLVGSLLIPTLQAAPEPGAVGTAVRGARSDDVRVLGPGKAYPNDTTQGLGKNAVELKGSRGAAALRGFTVAARGALYIRANSPNEPPGP